MRTGPCLVALTLALTAAPPSAADARNGARPAEIVVAQSEAPGCCRKWDRRARRWRRLESSRGECEDWNRKFDESERQAGAILKETGYIWWDQRCELRR